MREQRHALSEARDPRSDTFPLGEYFSAPAVRCARNAQAVRLSERGVAPSGAGTKRKGHPWFPFLFELLPFLQRAWVQMVDCVSVEKESGRGFFLPRGILTFAFRIIYCYTYRLFYAERGTR